MASGYAAHQFGQMTLNFTRTGTLATDGSGRVGFEAERVEVVSGHEADVCVKSLS